MKKWAEAIVTTPGTPFPLTELVACLDVSGEADGGAQVMADLKVLYPTAQYRWHLCEHDDGRDCEVLPA